MKYIRRDWPVVIKDWQASGQTKGKFCRDQGIGVTLFTQWEKKLGRRNERSHLSSKIVRDTPSFVEVVPVAEQRISARGALLKITTSYGCVLEIPL
ncbi:MAG: hypothetical protein PHF79_04115 [Candidatus Pacebacteria bacterium]|nr:hypothetical protein [Candidatus Paceibacterota bacterium]